MINQMYENDTNVNNIGLIYNISDIYFGYY